ncbi:TPA: hypothetical protein ACT9W9_003885 [Klebsiella pneumoniae]
MRKFKFKDWKKRRFLSRNNGTCWEVMSHERYNQLKDRKAQS